MKCTFCGNNVPDGSELCPECGMILSLDGSDNDTVTIPAYTPNVFGSEPIKVPEVPVQPVEEAVIAVPEYEPDKIFVDDKADQAVEAESVSADEPEEIAENTSEVISEEIPEEATVYEAPAYDMPEAEVPVYEVSEYDLSEEVYEAPAYGDEAVDSAYTAVEAEPVQTAEADSDDGAGEYESFAVQSEEQTVIDEPFTAYEEYDDTVKITPVIVPVEDTTADTVEEPPAAEQEEEFEQVDDDDDDTYLKSGKGGKVPTVIALCLLLVCLVVAGGYIVKKVLPSDGTTTTEPAAVVIGTATDATTQPSTQADDTTVSSAADNTTAEPDETTTNAVTTEPEETTTAPVVTEPTTTEPTTNPTTTKPTTRPSTTRPSTTRPTTTRPSTTVDPNGINGSAEIKKPSEYLSASYMGYTTKKVEMLGKPSSSSDWVQNLGKGAEVKVLAKESGYSYVYSTRFGTYGWVKSSFISESRPVESTTSVGKNTVSPDKAGSGETMYTTYSINLRNGPSTDYTVIKVIPINYPVKVIGYKSGASGWAYVTDLTSGKNGWVSTQYLKYAE